MKLPSTMGFALGCALLAGCAVPQAALDQANNSANLAQQLRVQLDNLKEQSAGVAQTRADDIADQISRQVRFDKDAQDNLALDRANNAPEAALFDQLRALSDGRVQTAAQADATMAALRKEQAAMLAAGSFDEKALADFQKQMAALGLPLSSKERLDLTLSFAQTLLKKPDDAASAPAAAASGPDSGASAPAAAPAASAPQPAASAP